MEKIYGLTYQEIELALEFDPKGTVGFRTYDDEENFVKGYTFVPSI